jgi:hypothetical protein
VFERLRKPKGAPPPAPRRAPTDRGPVAAAVTPLVNTRQHSAAIRLAYSRVLEDVQRAYEVTLAPGWTLPEFVARGLDARSEGLGEPLLKLYALYRPVRFGPPGTEGDSETLLELLDQIYGQRALFELYFRGRRPAAPASGLGGEPSEGESLTPPWRTDA